MGCDNLIPLEIVLKITAAIEAGERFCAYIIVPEHPDTKGAGRWEPAPCFPAAF